jgi:secondary thiamine-phosphate synthase enzyme
MKVFNTSFTLSTEERCEISDVTKLIREVVQQSPVAKSLIDRLVPERGGYRHDDPRYSDCERGNACAHLRAALLGRSIAVGLNNGELSLGRFQSVIFAELDGPRKREITVQVLGE